MSMKAMVSAISVACLAGFLLTGVASAQEQPRKGSFDWSLDEENGIIRLNTDDPTYAIWKQQRDRSKDPKREPGPIQLNRVVLGMPFHGIPTFLRRPVAIYPEDLVAGKVDAAFLGVPIDFNSVRRGTMLGPQAIRTAEVLMVWRSDGQPMAQHTETMIDPLSILNVVDYGDAPVELFSLERSIGATIPVVREAAKTGATLLIAGGSHSVPYPTVRGIVEANGGKKGSVGLIHFDAHQDLQPYGIGHAAHYGNFIRTLILDNIVEGKHIIQVGMRGPVNSLSGLDFQRKHGIKTIYMPEIHRDGFKAVAEKILKQFDDLPDKLYISLDLDFYDSSVAIGTTAAEPGGVMPGDFFPLIRAMAIKKHVVGMDIVEVAPMLDTATKSTMLLASRSFYELLVGMALKKQGIADPWYLHPDLIPKP